MPAPHTSPHPSPPHLPAHVPQHSTLPLRRDHLRHLLPHNSQGTNKPVLHTDESPAPYKETPFTRLEIEQAKSAKHSRPAEQDPEGHWGAPSEGFQLSITLEKDSFTNGEPLVAYVTLRNVSTNHLRYPVAFGNKDIETTILLTNGIVPLHPKDEPKPGATLQDRLRLTFRGSEASWPSRPGTQRKFPINLTALFDLSTSGTYQIQVKRKVPKIGQDATAEVASGVATFHVMQLESPR